MNIAPEYRWYEFNNIKSGTVIYRESKPSHYANMQEGSIKDLGCLKCGWTVRI